MRDFIRDNMREKITQKRLHELLDYSPDTGLFTWKVARAGRIKAGDVAGNLNNTGYIQITVDGTAYYAHRLAWLYIHGKFPENHIDHINGVRDDNRISNLRDVTPQENTSTLLSRKNTSDNMPLGKTGVKGVSVHRKKNKDGTVYERYLAQIVENKKHKSKYFPLTPEGLTQAKSWYSEQYNKVYGELEDYDEI